MSQIHNQSFSRALPMELHWNNVSITAKVPDPVIAKTAKKCQKVPQIDKPLISNSQGILRPGTFTALMGPSGSGKTTLLNFLSGRLYSSNLTLRGTLKMNGQEIKDIDKFSNEIAYVMQDDILLATFTPREAFEFVANLRLPHYTAKQKKEKVENLIQELGLQDASNTKIGNKMIRGVSGGERKRTSIGVELLTNPSMLFLDEPTTGLDSSTALQVIELLKYLAKNKGVNIVSTIHQPSSETFQQFQNLILLVRGNIIYQGVASQAVDYFQKQGFQCPPFSNPSDFFMKLMNEEGLMIEKIQRGEELPEEETIFKEFDNRLDNMIKYYENSPTDFTNQEKTSLKDTLQENSTSVFVQFGLLIQRAMRAVLRNPMDMKLKVIQSIFFALACIIVFNDLGDEGFPAIQNRNGLLFFLVTIHCFGSIQGSLAIFSEDKPLFLRERANKAYGAGAYYWSKTIAEMPFNIVYPCVTTAILYYICGLNDNESDKFVLCLLISVVTYFTGSAYGIFISVIVPSLELAMSLIPVLIVPLMVMGGFFVTSDQIPDWLKWLEYISMFKWGFQAQAINEFTDLDPISCGCVPYTDGDQQYLQLLKKNPEYSMGDCIPIDCDPLKQHDFTETLTETIIIQLGLGLAFHLLAVIGMYLISNPKRPKINPPLENTNKNIELQQQN